MKTIYVASELKLLFLIHKGRSQATFQNFEMGGSLKKNRHTVRFFSDVLYKYFK